MQLSETGDGRSKTKWQVEVDPCKCIGSGSCVAMARHQFTLNDQHRSEALREAMDPDSAVLNAALSCPVDAIAILEIDGDRAKRLAG